MRKRLLAMFVALSMIFVATGCGKGYKIGENGEVYNDYVKVKKWKELEVERVDPTPVTDEDVKLSIESDLQTLAETVDVKDRAAKKGDQVVIDYVGKLDGVAFQGGTGSDHKIVIGEAGFIDGFEDGIVGHKTGETFDLALTFPTDYSLNPDLAGKAVVFTVTLDKIQEIVVPELSDEVATKLNSKAKNVEEYKKLVRADLERNNKETAEYTMRTDLLKSLVKQSEIIEYPKDRMEKTLKSCTEVYTEQLEQMATMYYGTTLDELKETMGMSEEDLLGTTFEKLAEEQLLGELTLELIAKVEGIEYTGEAYEKFLEEQAEYYGYEDGETVEEAYEDMYGEGSFVYVCLQEKVSAFLYDNCVIVEPTETESETATE